MSMVPSVEALSTTMTSLSGYLWDSTDSRQRLMNRPLSYVTIVTETKSFCAMNQNQKGRSFLSPLYPKSRGRTEQQAAAREPHDFSVRYQRLQAPIENRFRNAPREGARHNGQTHRPEGHRTEMPG